jgi:hypothetical protein
MLTALATALALVQHPALPQGAPLPEGNAYVRGLLGRQRQREEALDRYTYDVHQVEEGLDKGGVATERRTRGYELFHVKGRPVRRQVSENGRPLPARARAKEDRRARELAAALLAGRVATERPALRLSQILERYDFRSVARESLGGRPTLLLEFAPLPGKRPIDGDGVLRTLAGRIWVDEAQRELVRAEVRNTAAVKFAFGLGARVSSLSFEVAFQPMPDGLWLPERLAAEVGGGVLLLKGFRRRVVESYDNYRVFEVRSSEELLWPRE